MSIEQEDRDGPKMTRETLCVAQHALAQLYPGAHSHLARLQRMIDQIDVLRPLGSDGKHGNRHTPFCGCEDVAAGFCRPEPVTFEPGGTFTTVNNLPIRME